MYRSGLFVNTQHRCVLYRSFALSVSGHRRFVGSERYCFSASLLSDAVSYQERSFAYLTDGTSKTLLDGSGCKRRGPSVFAYVRHAH